MPFEAITLTRIDMDSIERVSEEPLEYQAPFVLSDTPPEEWTKIVDRLWEEEKQRLADSSETHPVVGVKISENKMLVTLNSPQLTARDPFNPPPERIEKLVHWLIEDANGEYGRKLEKEEAQLNRVKHVLSQVGI
jgi:hypothetical protein